MQDAYLAIVLFFACLFIGLLAITNGYFYVRRSNFMLQTRSAHILVLLSTFTIFLCAVWAASELIFAVQQDSIPTHLLAIVSHLFLPCTVMPLMFRGQAFLIMLNPALRKKYVRFIRKRMSLKILGAFACLTGILPYGLQVAGNHPYFDMNQNQFTIGANLFFGEWRYFLPLFLVYIIAQSIQLYHLTVKSRVEDTFGIVADLKFVLGATITFTALYFTWLICLAEGVHPATFSVLQNHDWMRLNHLVMLFQLCIYCKVLVRPLYQVYAHTHQQAEKASLYADRGKWLKGSTGSGEVLKIRIAPSDGTDGGKNSSRVSAGNKLALQTESPATSTNRLANSYIHDSSPSPYSSPGSSWQHGTLMSPTVNSRNRLKSLRDILLHDASRALFSEFAQKHLCLESVMFFMAVEQYQSHPGWSGLDLKEVYEFGCSMYTSFVATGSEFEVNVPGDVKAQLRKIFGKVKFDFKLDFGFGGDGVATGLAAAAASNTSQSTNGRYEAFLSLPSTSRKELYRAAQDEVYELLKVNLYQTFFGTPEFQNIKREFDARMTALNNPLKVDENGMPIQIRQHSNRAAEFVAPTIEQDAKIDLLQPVKGARRPGPVQCAPGTPTTPGSGNHLRVHDNNNLTASPSRRRASADNAASPIAEESCDSETDLPQSSPTKSDAHPFAPELSLDDQGTTTTTTTTTGSAPIIRNTMVSPLTDLPAPPAPLYPLEVRVQSLPIVSAETNPVHIVEPAAASAAPLASDASTTPVDPASPSI